MKIRRVKNPINIVFSRGNKIMERLKLSKVLKTVIEILSLVILGYIAVLILIISGIVFVLLFLTLPFVFIWVIQLLFNMAFPLLGLPTVTYLQTWAILLLLLLVSVFLQRNKLIHFLDLRND